jgi:hypothetical protein
VLKLRGGLAGVSPDAVATGLLTLASVNSGFVSLAPEPAAKAYGMSGTNLLQNSMIENMGMLLVGLCIGGWMAMKGSSAAQVVAASLIPSLVNIAKWLLNGTAAKIGMPDTGNYLNAAIMAAAIASLLGGYGDAGMIINAVSGWWAFNGVVAAVMPDKLAGAYGLKEMDKDTTGLMQSFGSFLTNFAVFSYLIGTGQPAAKAIGLSFIPGTVVQLDQMFGRKMGPDLDMKPQYFWLLVNAAGIAFTNF